MCVCVLLFFIFIVEGDLFNANGGRRTRKSHATEFHKFTHTNTPHRLTARHGQVVTFKTKFYYNEPNTEISSTCSSGDQVKRDILL